MISLILALAIAAPEQKMCTVPCKPKAKVVKKTTPKPTVSKTEIVEKVVCCQAPVTVVVQQPQQSQVQIATPQPSGPQKRSWFGVGGRAALGLTTCNPYTFGLLGVRLKSEKAHLGLDLTTNFAYGFGASLLVYPYIGDNLSVHVNAGVLAFGAKTFANAQVPRQWDLTLGAGIEYRLPIRWLSLTVDYRYAVANPVALAGEEVYGISRNAAWGNAFIRSQLMLGVMAHTW